MSSVSEKVYSLIKTTVENIGVNLWDVRFVKEGASHYLRVFIDKPEGVSIDDCADVSRAIDPIIDKADPIDVSYYLEVCSPGLERELVRDGHFTAMIGRKIKIRLFKAVDGKKEFVGVLKAFDGNVTIDTDSGTMSFERSAVAKAVTAEDN